MADLRSFGLEDMYRCSAAVRALGAACATPAEAGQRIVDYFYEELRAGVAPGCALVRLFRTAAAGDLDEDDLAFLRARLDAPPAPDARVLVLEATRGAAPEWNDRRRSRVHRVMPLDRAGGAVAPMVAGLVRRIEGLASAVAGGAPGVLDVANVFHVPEAAGSALVPDQRDFVAPYGVRSVLAFGGPLPGALGFVVVLFATVPISDECAERFRTVAPSVGLALLASDPHPAALAHRVEAMEALLRHQQRIALERDRSLRRTVEALARSGERAREVARRLERAADIIESSENAIVGGTPDGVATSWNRGAERMYGWTKGEMIGRHLSVLVPPDRSADRDMLAACIARGERVPHLETVHVRKDGTRLEVSIAAAPLRDDEGRLVGFASIARDITEQKRVERALRESEERYRLAVEAAHLGMWSWDAVRGTIVLTDEARRALGLPSQGEVAVEKFRGAFAPEDLERLDDAARRAIAEHTDFRGQYRVVWPDGSPRWVSVLGRAFYGRAGVREIVTGVILDVTAQKLAEQERADLLAREQVARAESEAAGRAKDEFLAVLSHELRTPLQSMLGWTQVLRRRDLHGDETLRKGLDTMERNIRAQARLIEDLLDVSRIVAGKLRVQRQRIELSQIVRSAVESARSAIDARGVRVDSTLATDEMQVLGDPDRLQQVVSNLLSNAVKFSSPGQRIEVRLECRGTVGVITVRDEGAGVAPAFLPNIFDRFRQADSSMRRSRGGLGLGLAIVRHLVELHGGSVRAESAGEGRGATFTVELPLISAKREAVSTEERGARAGAAATTDLHGVRILVVDDDPDACEVLETTLHEWGADVHAVESARAAIGEIDSFHPDLLVSDIGMPEVDGYELIRRVRERESSLGGHLPALALSAFASRTDRELALANGFEAHMAKPADGSDLARTVARLVGRDAA